MAIRASPIHDAARVGARAGAQHLPTMNELEDVTRAVRALRAARDPFVVATVVRVTGSAYRRPGARLVIGEGRRIVGCVSGGCLEADLVQRGFFRTERAPVVVTYDARSDDGLREGFGIGCDGIVDVLLERGDLQPGADDAFLAMERVLANERPTVLVTTFRTAADGIALGTRAIDDRSAPTDIADDVRALVERARETGRTLTGDLGDRAVLCEHIAPPAHLFVFGAGHDVPPLVALARGAGFRVTVCVHEDRLAIRERFGAAARVVAGPFERTRALLDATFCPAVVVMGHHLERDQAALAVALASRARYVGVLGPRSRTRRLLEGLRHPSFEGGPDPRLFAPAGLRLGGDAPEAVALSIVAEARAVLSGRPGGHHRDHWGAIHELPEQIAPVRAARASKRRRRGSKAGRDLIFTRDCSTAKGPPCAIGI